MPTREGYYSGGAGQAGAHGAFEGLGNVFSRMRDERTKDRASRRTLKREEDQKLFDEALTHVKSGEMTPDEASAQTGVRAEQFHPFVPAPETMVAKLNSTLKPDTTDEEASVQMHALAPFRKTPNVQTPSPFSEPGSLEYESPIQAQISKLLDAKRSRADDDAPVTQIGESARTGPVFGQANVETETGNVPEAPLGGDVTPQHIYGRFNKRLGSIEEVGRVDSGLSAATKGQATGIEETSAAPGKGKAQTLVENALRGPKVETARSLQQSNIDTDTAPANVAREARKQSQITYATTRARDEATRAGVPPEIANTFLRATSMGNKYAYFPPGTPEIDRKVAMDTLAKTVPDIRFLNAQQQSAIASVETARENFDNIMQLVQSHLAKDYRGDVIAAPRNYLASIIKSDPQLASAVAAFPEKIQALRAIAGQFGRITQQEIFRAINSFPSITDPMDVVMQKRGTYFNSLENVENGVLGVVKKKPTIGGARAQ